MSSEDVLLIVSHVKHKKVEGSMYMMDTRMAWMPGSSDTFKISHSYADIRGKGGLVQKCPCSVRLLGTRFKVRHCTSEPGPQESRKTPDRMFDTRYIQEVYFNF
jgi:hypothetical protein